MWQRIYEEINDPNFVIICAAEDTGGEAAAGPIFDAANPTYIQVVDEDHLISSAFNFVNVPSAAWIDETGRIVRIDEGTYSMIHSFGEGEQAISFGTDVYEPALKDWVQRGPIASTCNRLKPCPATFERIRVINRKRMPLFGWGTCFECTARKPKPINTGRWRGL